MIDISPRVVGITIMSLLVISLLTFLFKISPAIVITLIVTFLISSSVVFSIALIGSDRWPWER